MISRSIVGLIFFMTAVAMAGNNTTASSADRTGKGDRTRVAKRPVAAATAVSALPPASFGPGESLGAPLDRNPLPAYASLPPGPPQTISGQCFVVTDAGRKIKLDGVEVGIYPQREFEWYAQQVNARAKARYEGMKAVACPRDFAALSVADMDRSLAAAEVLQHDLHVVWQVLPAADASTKTDADGRFLVTHRVAPPFVVFATGSRTAGDETEYYRWQISSNVITNPLEVELSNAELR